MTTLAAPWGREVLAGQPPAPVVLELGGSLTSPPMCRAFERDLRATGAADVVVARVWAMGWLIAASRGAWRTDRGVPLTDPPIAGKVAFAGWSSGSSSGS